MCKEWLPLHAWYHGYMHTSASLPRRATPPSSSSLICAAIQKPPTCQTITHTRPKQWSSDVWFASKEQCALDETYSVEYTWSDKIKPSEPSKGSSYHYTWELSYVNEFNLGPSVAPYLAHHHIPPPRAAQPYHALNQGSRFSFLTGLTGFNANSFSFSDKGTIDPTDVEVS